MFKLLPRFDESADQSSATSNVDSAENTGQTAINSYDPTAAGNSSTAAVNSNFGTQQGENSQAVQPLASTIASNPTVTSLYQTANQDFGVQPLAQQAATLQNRVTNAVPDAYSGAYGYDIDNADVQNGIAQKEAYLIPQEQATTNNAQTAENLAAQQVQAGIAQNNFNLIPAQENATLTGQNLATQGTGLNQAQQAILTGLMQKMESGVQLSQTEMQTMAQLFQTEEAYNAQIAANQTAIQEAKINNQYQIIPSTSNLFNTFANSAINPAKGTSQSSQGVATYG